MFLFFLVLFFLVFFGFWFSFRNAPGRQNYTQCFMRTVPASHRPKAGDRYRSVGNQPWLYLLCCSSSGKCAQVFRSQHSSVLHLCTACFPPPPTPTPPICTAKCNPQMSSTGELLWPLGTESRSKPMGVSCIIGVCAQRSTSRETQAT